MERIPEPAGPPVELAILDDTSDMTDTVSRNRLVIGGLLLAFLLLAVLAAVGIGRDPHRTDRHIPGRGTAPRARRLRPPGPGHRP